MRVAFRDLVRRHDAVLTFMYGPGRMQPSHELGDAVTDSVRTWSTDGFSAPAQAETVEGGAAAATDRAPECMPHRAVGFRLPATLGRLPSPDVHSSDEQSERQAVDEPAQISPVKFLVVHSAASHGGSSSRARISSSSSCGGGGGTEAWSESSFRRFRASSPGFRKHCASDTEEHDLETTWRKVKRMAMTDSAADSWVDGVARPISFIRFNCCKSVIGMVACALFAILGSAHLPSWWQITYRVVGGIKFSSTVLWSIAMHLWGPSYHARRHTFWLVHTLLEVLSVLALLAIAPFQPPLLMPFQDRFIYLVCAAVIVWTSVSGALCCSAPWECKYRKGSLFPVLWSSGLRTVRFTDALSDLCFMCALPEW